MSQVGQSSLTKQSKVVRPVGKASSVSEASLSWKAGSGSVVVVMVVLPYGRCASRGSTYGLSQGAIAAEEGGAELTPIAVDLGEARLAQPTEMRFEGLALGVVLAGRGRGF